MTRDFVLVPSTPALLPAYAGAEDPVPDLRSACGAAVRWLVARHPGSLRVASAPLRPEELGRGLDSPAGERVARHLLAEAGFGGRLADEAAGVVVVANGTARRSERAPGHLDGRAAGFDAEVERRLRAGEPLDGLDAAVAEELWVRDWPALVTLAEVLGGTPLELDYSDDPFGVQYWVGRATCES